jgi:hypothetical protein
VPLDSELAVLVRKLNELYLLKDDEERTDIELHPRHNKTGGLLPPGSGHEPEGSSGMLSSVAEYSSEPSVRR